MAKLKIYTFPDAILTHKAKPIARLEKARCFLDSDPRKLKPCGER